MVEFIPETRAPSMIGSLVASIAGIELDRFLGSTAEIARESLVSRELFVSAGTHRQYLATLKRSPSCRFDHETWNIEFLDDGPLDRLIEAAGMPKRGSAIRLDGRNFVRSVSCPRCGTRETCFALHDRLPDAARVCVRCGGNLHPSVLELFDELPIDALAPSLRERPLTARGLVPGDVFAIRAGDEVRHFELSWACGEAVAGIGAEPAWLGSKPVDGTGVRSVILVGCGNIGSQLVGHVARMVRSHGIAHILLADPDVYSADNLIGQEISRADIGRAKVDVCAARMRAIDPELHVVAHRGLFETLPLGTLRGAIVVAGVDSRGARQRINQACWRVGTPFIDTAVDGPSLLCRVTTYTPDATSPCLECGWEDSDYRLLEHTVPCQEDAANQGETDGEATQSP